MFDLEDAIKTWKKALAKSQEFTKVRSMRHKGGSLLGNYVRIALRKMRRRKAYSFITIAGLAVGLACCILMMLWVTDELSFDRFHANRDSIYRLITETTSETGVTLDARAPTPTGPAVQADFPEILEFCRYRTSSTYGIRSGDKTFFDEIIGIAD